MPMREGRQKEGTRSLVDTLTSSGYLAALILKSTTAQALAIKKPHYSGGD